jgi:hypothetical protein
MYGGQQFEQDAIYGGQQDTMYGSGYGAPQAVKSQFFRGSRKRMNIIGVCVSLFVPWVLFSVIYAVMSFSMHYHQPALCHFIVALGLIVVLACGTIAFSSLLGRSKGDMEREPSWFVFLFLTTLIAWVLAIVLGDMNFRGHLQPYYDVANLNTYQAVNPAQMRGQQYMDAGRIIFSEGTKLDISRSIGFKNLETYCVAPITNGEAPLSSYDFWAVGTNCCSSNSADFQCGEFNNPRATAGLRLMNDDQRAFFRLAVQMSEAAYSIKAIHPLFFHWMQDPIAEMNAYQDDGLKYYLLGMFAHFAFQLFLVVVATIGFSKMGYY